MQRGREATCEVRREVTTVNDENSLLLFHVPNVAAQYAAEWQHLWTESN
jgi:hypothetical protein